MEAALNKSTRHRRKTTKKIRQLDTFDFTRNNHEEIAGAINFSSPQGKRNQRLFNEITLATEAFYI